jgi:hypothetical protein
MLRLELLDDGVRDVAQVAPREIDRDSFSQPRPREVEQLLDHPAHALRAPRHAGQDLARVVGHEAVQRVQRRRRWC